MGRFGHVSGKPSHVEGGLSAWGFASCVNRTPNTTKEVSECEWLWFSSAEKSIPSRRPGGGAPSRYACCLLGFAREALGRSLDWGLWAGGAKWGVSGMFPRNRRMLRVGCPRGILLFASIRLQTSQRRCPNAGGHSLAAPKKVFEAAPAEGRRPVMLACLLVAWLC